MTLQGKSAVVAAAGSGIGRMSAIALAEAGASVCLIDLDGDAVSELADQLRNSGHEAFAYQVDLTDVAAVRRLAVQVSRADASSRRPPEQRGGAEPARDR